MLAGFGLASALTGSFDVWLLTAAAAGSSLVIACGCVINNYIDRQIDRKMKRTKERPLVTGTISNRRAIIFGISLGIAGSALLFTFVNTLTLLVGIFGLYFYLVPYSYAKRRYPISTLIGSVSGATPILAGYTAAAGYIDTAALLLFAAMAAWQMPHFYAIALFRQKEYAAAGIPVLTIVKGAKHTKLAALAYIPLFTAICIVLTVFGYTGYSFAAGIAAVAAWWFWRGAVTFTKLNDIDWGRQMFAHSLLVMVAFSLLVAVGSLLP